MKHVQTVILGGGRGTRLRPLTEVRSKPAVPIGGKYRLIDVPISNCLHAGLERIYVLTQFNSNSLHRHIKRTYVFDTFSGGFVDILAAEQTDDNPKWFQGTADAVRQQLRHILRGREEQVLVLSGDHLYRMNYREFLESHREAGADLSIGVQPVSRKDARSFGILKMAPGGRIIDFVEKPTTDEELAYLRLGPEEGWHGEEEAYLASMGIYVFQPDTLVRLLHGTEGDDFGRDIIPGALKDRHVHGYLFEGYWRDIGTISSFFDASLELTERDPPFDFHADGAPIYTHPRFLAGATLHNCTVDRAMIGDGSLIIEADIERAVIGIRSVIGRGTKIRDLVMMGADWYETPEDRESNKRAGRPDIGIGPGCVIERAIIDKNARIGEGVRITDKRGEPDREGKRYHVVDGLVVVPKNAVILPGTVI